MSTVRAQDGRAVPVMPELQRSLREQEYLRQVARKLERKPERLRIRERQRERE